jgi:hypothetical protein
MYITELLHKIADFISLPQIRWFFFLSVICLTVLVFIQEPIRFSGIKGITGISMKWQIYIIAIVNALNYIITFLALWYTIPFSYKLSAYWYVPIFIIILAIYTQFTINAKITTKDGTFNPPPDYLLPKKYRMFFHYLILVLDILIFTQFFLAEGNIGLEVKTYLDKYIFGRFGGFIEGNRLSFLASWLGLIGLGNDIYNIQLQNNFKACKYNLPDSWNI